MFGNGRLIPFFSTELPVFSNIIGSKTDRLMETPREWIDAGAWVGRQQAFAVIANKCSAAQALCLKQVRDSQLFEKLGLRWEEFCKEYAGISRVHADRLIQQHEEFGDAYFRLSEIARISPETYRQIAGQVSDDGLEFDGRKLALTPENAPKIRAAIQTLRSQLKQARDANQPTAPGITQLQIRLDALIEEISRMTHRLLDPGDRAGLQGLAAYAIRKWTDVAHFLENR